MGKGGAGKQGGRQLINGPRQIGTITEWKGHFGWIKPSKPISHPNSKGKVYLKAEDVSEELDGVGAQVSFQLYSDSNGLGAADCKMATAAAKAAASSGAAKSTGKGKSGATKVGATFSKGKGKAGATTVAARFPGKVAATNSPAVRSKFGATLQATAKAAATKPGLKFSTAAKFKSAGAKALAANKVPATWSKSAPQQSNFQKKSVVQQTAWQKPRHQLEQLQQKGGFAKGFAKGKAQAGQASQTNSKGGAGKGGKGKQPRQIIWDKPLIGTIKQWKGKFGWVKPKDTIDHPLASKHQGDLFLSQEDVESEINGVGARVRFMLYQDSHGLGAANVNAA